MNQTDDPTLQVPDGEATPAEKRLRLTGRMRCILGGILALAAGIAAAVAHPPWSIWAGLAGYPLLMVLSDRAATLRNGFWIGWIAGFGYFIVSCWWVAEAFLVNPDQAWMAPLAGSLLPAGLALFWGGAIAAYKKLAAGRGVERVFVFTALFCLFEWLRGHVLTGLPWNPVGATWPAGSAPSQIAAYVGVYGLGVLTVLGISMPALLAGPGRWKVKAGYIVAGAVLIGTLFIGGTARLSVAQVRLTPTTVRIVQPDVDQQSKWEPDQFEAVVRRYTNLSANPSGPRPDVVIWPEGALPITANDAFSSWVGPSIDRALEPGQTLVAGFSRAEAGRDGEPRYFNSLFVLHDNGELRISAIYDKYRLVPFGEFLPLGGLMSVTGIRSLVHVPADFSAGPRPRPIEIPGAPRAQPLICYESLYPGFTSTVGGRPGWIVNISNDAWFGRTSGPRQHLNLAAYRAIETGLPMVRATPTGISALVDPWGRVGSHLEPGESGVLDVRLPQPTAPTLYSKIGDSAFLIVVVFLLISGLRFRTETRIS
ncbi:MAG: apolipoprotein N-acyltransferase [Caulobacterales bacterium]|nr:apolipoprotein N-acyltransferase [Caulobacterales bacterium]